MDGTYLVDPIRTCWDGAEDCIFSDSEAWVGFSRLRPTISPTCQLVEARISKRWVARNRGDKIASMMFEPGSVCRRSILKRLGSMRSLVFTSGMRNPRRRFSKRLSAIIE